MGGESEGGVGVEKAVESGAADAEEAGGADFVAIDAGEDAGDVMEDGAVEVRVFGEPVRGSAGDEVCGGRDGGGPLEAGDIERADPLTGTVEGSGGDDGFEFANVAGPDMGGEAAESAGGETAEELAVEEAPLTKKEGSEEGQIVATVAQRGKEEADGGEMAGKIGAEGAGGGEATKRVGGSDDDLEGAGHPEVAEAFVGGALEEVAEEALLVRGQLVDAGKIGETAGGVLPEGLRSIQEVGGKSGGERSGGGRADAMESLGGEKLAGSGFAFDGDETEMGSGAAHAGEELLHGETAASHGAEHPLFRMEGVRLERFDAERFGGQKGGSGIVCREQGVGVVGAARFDAVAVVVIGLALDLRQLHGSFPHLLVRLSAKQRGR